MADVLSQSQIDALLKSMSADAPAQESNGIQGATSGIKKQVV